MISEKQKQFHTIENELFNAFLKKVLKLKVHHFSKPSNYSRKNRKKYNEAYNEYLNKFKNLKSKFNESETNNF